jgi:hypothetical protein
VIGVKSKAVLLVTVAIILVSGCIGAVYACFEIPYPVFYTPGQVELKIRDQDEAWGNGVLATWTASNMAPGDEFTFNGHFVGLKSQFAQKVNRGLLDITCRYDPWTAWQPDKMAKYMVITRCVYNYTDMNQIWQINFLTGKSVKISPSGGGNLVANINWQIQDVDRDGIITFHDLKMKSLNNIPLYSANEARFEMSVYFHQDAGNEFQGDIFNLTMIYTLAAW